MSEFKATIHNDKEIGSAHKKLFKKCSYSAVQCFMNVVGANVKKQDNKHFL
jgi:hypothetical protein